MHPSLHSCITLWADRDKPTPALFQGALAQILNPETDAEDVYAFLAAQSQAPITVELLVAAAHVIRSRMTRFPVTTPAMDTCGTGGDRQSLFNISTAVSFVMASAGIPVVKHGNRAASSHSGSSDVMRQLGIHLEVSPETMQQCFQSTGYAYLATPLYHPGLLHLAPIRKRLGMPTIFNFVGPLCNPAQPYMQLLGVGKPEMHPIVAQAIANLGSTTAFVIHGEPGLDEVSLSGKTNVLAIKNNSIQELIWEPSDFGLEIVDLDTIRCQSAEESAKTICGIFQGEAGPAERMVLANSAAGLLLAGKVSELKEGVELSRTLLRSGSVWNLLQRLQAGKG